MNFELLGVSIRKNFGACLYWRFAERDASGVPIMKQVIGSFIHHKEPIPRSALRGPLLGFGPRRWLHGAKTPKKKGCLFFFAEGTVCHCFNVSIL